MYMPHRFFNLLVLFPILLLGGCDSFDPSSQNDASQPRIVLISSGGFGGGILDSLTISPEGLATNHLVTPPLHLQLSEKEQQRISNLFVGFFLLRESYGETRCEDDIKHIVTYRAEGKSKTVSAWGCQLYIEDELAPELEQFRAIVDALRALDRRIYEEQAPWRGVEVTFSTDRTLYKKGEPITFQYHISNPTDEPRTLYFRYMSRYMIHVSGLARPTYVYEHPGRELKERPDGLDSLLLRPGQKITLEYAWNQTVNLEALTEDDSPRQRLAPGQYYVYMSLLDTGHHSPIQGFHFNVVDPDVPLAGHVVEDWRHAGQNADTYTFKLLLRNWTNHKVTLHFPKRQSLRVSLYDVNFSAPYQRFFTSTEEPAAVASSLTLPPGDSTIIERTFRKDDLNLPDDGVLAHVDLLAEGIDFVRRRSLRIAR